jgi:citrate synthase
MVALEGPAAAGEWVETQQAARRLGVKPATLYAYVSRGLLVRRRGSDGRSLFDPAELDLLARRGGTRRPRGAPDFVVESSITELRDGRPLYRGRDTLELARSWSLERTGEWLWGIQQGAGTSGLPAVASTAGAEAVAGEAAVADWAAAADWAAPADSVAVGRAVQAALPNGILPLERLQVIVTTLAATDPVRRNLAPQAVAAVGRHLVAGMVDCLPGPAVTGPVATRLWAKLSPIPASSAPALVDVLRAALVLLADHELASSTLAARVAASVRADPYAVVTAGLGVLGGTLHGGASLGAETMLADARSGPDASRAVTDRLRRGERIPGFGHAVYRSGDRRATFLLDAIRTAAPNNARVTSAETVLATAERHGLPAPSIDFALATLAAAGDMTRGAGEVVFAVARVIGWLAHALEEYAHPTLPRPRAVYVGPGAVSSGQRGDVTDIGREDHPPIRH